MTGQFQSDNLLNALNAARSKSIRGIVDSKKLTRLDREILQRTGHIKPIMRGWYHFSSNPVHQDQSLEPISFFRFLSVYLDDRLGEKWCFSAQSSLELLLFPEIIPPKLVVTAMYSSTTVKNFTDLTKLTIYEDAEAYHPGFEQVNGLRLLPLEIAITRLPKMAWKDNPELIRAALKALDTLEGITWRLMQEGRQQAASRLADALQKADRKKEANDLITSMIQAGYPITTPLLEIDNFELTKTADKSIVPIPATIKVRPTLNSLWSQWKTSLTHLMMAPPEGKPPLLQHLANLQNLHVQDTIHSLKLSGFNPTEEFILDILALPEKSAETMGWPILTPAEKILKPGHSQPLPGDTDPMTSLACQGYIDAFKAVKRSIIRLLENENMGLVVEEDLKGWHQALVGPTTQGGFYSPATLNEFREIATAPTNQQNHCPAEAIAEEMDQLKILLNSEESGINMGTMANLSIHWISPWTSGNGRLARFLMNALMAGTGCDWSIISGGLQGVYGRAVEDALVSGNAGPMAILISNGVVRTPR